MKRRVFLITIVVALLLISSFIGVQARNLALTATMSATPSPVTFPQADFVGTPLSGTAPLTVQFTPLYTSTGSPILGCSWVFGDGTSQFVSGSFTTCPPISHVYTLGGNLTAQLSVQITDMVFTVTKPNYVHVGGPTATVTRTPIPCGAIIVVTSTFTPTITATPTRTATATATSCGPIYQTATPSGPTLTPTLTSQAPLPDLIVLSITETIVPNPTATLKSNGCTSTNTGTRYALVKFQNVGAGDAGAFVVGLNGSQQTVSGLAAGQTSSVSFLAPFTTRTATVDATNLVAESNETNNSLTVIITPGPTTTGTAPATVCVTLTPSKTWTPVITPTRTSSPTITRTVTRTPTGQIPTTSPSPTSTPTLPVSTCSPVTSTITAPFTFDGAGTFCWQSSNLGAYINSWNMTSVTMNGVNITNLYIAAGSYPAKIGGFWYVGYNSSVAWGHFEAK